MSTPSISVFTIFIVFGLIFVLIIRFSKTYPQWSLHPLRFPRSRGTETFLTVKEGSTFLTKPLFPQEREDVTALRCSEPLRSKVGGPKRSSPYCAGWDRLTTACRLGLMRMDGWGHQNSSSLQYRSALVATRMGKNTL